MFYSQIPLDVSFHWYCKEQLVKKLLKILQKTSMVEFSFEWNFGTACMKLYEYWTLPRIFFEIYSASNNVAYCILYYIVLNPVSAGLYPSTFGELRFSWRIEFYDLRIWGAVVGSPCRVQGAIPLEALAISSIPGIQIAFPCIIWWLNLFHF